MSDEVDGRLAPMNAKPLRVRVEECVNLRGQMRHTDLLHTGNNDEVIKEAMNAFVREGRPDTLRLWANERRNVRAVLVLSANPKKQSGVTLEVVSSR